MTEHIKKSIGIFFNRVFGLTVPGAAAVALIAAVFGVLQTGAFREVMVVVVLVLGRSLDDGERFHLKFFCQSMQLATPEVRATPLIPALDRVCQRRVIRRPGR